MSGFVQTHSPTGITKVSEAHLSCLIIDFSFHSSVIIVGAVWLHFSELKSNGTLQYLIDILNYTLAPTIITV